MRYLTLAVVAVNLLFAGCSGVAEIKPPKKGKELTEQEKQEVQKKMDEARTKAMGNMPPEMVEKMKQMGNVGGVGGPPPK